MLTVKQLRNMQPDTIFATGFGYIEHPWFPGRKAKVKWVAIRGNIGDWAIYHSLDSNLARSGYPEDTRHLDTSNEVIARLGAKLHDKNKIREFVPCTDMAFEMYRY